jgi:hypothetical protein
MAEEIKPGIEKTLDVIAQDGDKKKSITTKSLPTTEKSAQVVTKGSEEILNDPNGKGGRVIRGPFGIS